MVPNSSGHPLSIRLSPRVIGRDSSWGRAWPHMGLAPPSIHFIPHGGSKLKPLLIIRQELSRSLSLELATALANHAGPIAPRRRSPIVRLRAWLIVLVAPAPGPRPVPNNVQGLPHAVTPSSWHGHGERESSRPCSLYPVPARAVDRRRRHPVCSARRRLLVRSRIDSTVVRGGGAGVAGGKREIYEKLMDHHLSAVVCVASSVPTPRILFDSPVPRVPGQSPAVVHLRAGEMVDRKRSGCHNSLCKRRSWLPRCLPLRVAFSLCEATNTEHCR